MTDVVGASEIAELLGVSRQRVYELIESHEDFPHPIARLARGSVWERSAIERWAAKWTRTPGRRPQRRQANK